MTTALAGREAKFDDVMLAMDVVDTLRHRELVLTQEFNTEEKKAGLIARLRDIYRAQGIEVPDRILEDGVKALEEHRFSYPAVTPGFGRRLAMIYIGRQRWLAPLAVALGLAALAALAFHFAVAAPRDAREERDQTALTQTLPAALTDARTAALALAGTDAARARIAADYDRGMRALAAGDAAGARAAQGDIAFLKDVLASDLIIRVVSRPGEYSGVFRIPEDAPQTRNFYLIVEAVDAAGAATSIEIASEEDQRTARVSRWGVRVPEDVFNAVAADKQDDQIIQNARVGAKPKGALAPDYAIPAGGAIVEW